MNLDICIIFYLFKSIFTKSKKYTKIKKYTKLKKYTKSKKILQKQVIIFKSILNTLFKYSCTTYHFMNINMYYFCIIII